MLDLKAIRDDPAPFREGLARRGLAGAVDELLVLDARRRELVVRVEELRAEQNRTSREIGSAQGDQKQRLIQQVGAVSAELKKLEPDLSEVEEKLGELLAATPNVPDPSAPLGFTDEDAVEVRRHGEPPSFTFDPRDHAELGELLGVLDVDRGVRTSGSRFVYLIGDIVLVQWALVRHAMDVLVDRGFVPVIPPVLVREEAMYGTGFLPTDAVNIYVTKDDMYLAGTSEVPLASYHMGEILDEVHLPIRYAGYSTCFRREAGSYGKDLGGMFRVHQFDKVEMFSFTRPEDSWDEHELMVGIEEQIIGILEIPYRVVNVAAGDLGGAAAKKYDIEGWLPAQDRYRELTSCSNCTDYQARRLQTRVRRTSGGQIETLHTLNGTATAVGRTLIAILENRQREDGSVSLPPALYPYLPERLRELTPRSRV